MSPEPARAGDLVLRLVAYLFLTAAILFGLVAGSMLLLDRTDVGGSVRYVLPGSQATLDQRIVAVLAGCAAVTGLPGLALLLVPHLKPNVGVGFAARPRSRSRHPFFVLTGGLALLAIAILVRRFAG